MVSDVGNEVGLMDYIFLYNIVCSVNFVILSWGSLASPTVALSWGVPHHAVGAQHQEYVFELIHEFLRLPTDTSVYSQQDLLFPFLNTEESFLWALFLHEALLLSFVSPMDSDFIAALTFLFPCPQTTTRKTGVFFFTSLFSCLTEMTYFSRDSLDVPSVDFLFFSVLCLPLLNLPFRFSF